MIISSEFMGVCACCDKPKQELHHLVFGRGMRNLADQDKLIIPCCSECHRKIHESGVAGQLSKMLGQLEFELQQVEKGVSQGEARVKFRARYGRSYL